MHAFSVLNSPIIQTCIHTYKLHDNILCSYYHMEWNTLEGEILQVSRIFANRVSFRILVKELKGNVMYYWGEQSCILFLRVKHMTN